MMNHNIYDSEGRAIPGGFITKPVPAYSQHLKNLGDWLNGERVVWFTFGDYDDWRCAEMTRQQYDIGIGLGWSAYRVGSPN